MTFSGICGTLVGLATCGLLICKTDTDSMRAAFLMFLTSFGTGFATTYVLHHFLRNNVSQDLFLMLENEDGPTFDIPTLNPNLRPAREEDIKNLFNWPKQMGCRRRGV